MIAVGDGLTLNSGTLSSSSFNLGSLPLQTNLLPEDQIVVTNAGTSQLVGLNQVRELFTAGSNITIDANGIISTSSVGGGTNYSLSGLSSVQVIASGDLVGVSQSGADHTITYANLLDGLTIDLASPAAAASDGDTLWVGQASNVMLRQSLSAIWPWISGKLASWTRPIIELIGNTSLNGAVHNNAVLICSSPLLISIGAGSIGSGFSCELINASSGMVTFSSGILTSNGSSGLSPYQCASIQCITYSAGTTVFASISAGSTATVAPGQVTGLTASSVASSVVGLSWSAPGLGGSVSVYSIQYRITGTTTWGIAGQNNGSLNFVVTGLQSVTSYDFAVNAINNVGTGPTSSVLTTTTSSGATLPGAPTSVTASNITSSSMTFSWSPPTSGGVGMVYTVQYRVTGQSAWVVAASNLSGTTTNLSNLTASTSYDIRITASLSGGSGPPSTAVTAQTLQLAGLVTGIVWNLAPTGTFAHGSGAIGVNVHVTPASAAVQFGFSTSSSLPPTSWVTGVFVNSDLWGQYLPTPATPGSWFGWAEGTDGSSPTAYATPFTVT